MAAPIQTAKDFREWLWRRFPSRVKPVFQLRTRILPVRIHIFVAGYVGSVKSLVSIATLPISVSIGSSLGMVRTIAIALIAGAFVRNTFVKSIVYMFSCFALLNYKLQGWHARVGPFLWLIRHTFWDSINHHSLERIFGIMPDILFPEVDFMICTERPRVKVDRVLDTRP